MIEDDFIDAALGKPRRINWPGVALVAACLASAGAVGWLAWLVAGWVG